MEVVSFCIKQHKLKDVLAFLSNNTEEVTCYATTKPRNMISFYASLSSNRIYLSLDQTHLTSFELVSTDKEIVSISYNIYVNSLLNPINTFKKNDDIFITMSPKCLNMKGNGINSSIGCINSIANHYFCVPHPKDYLIKSTAITDINHFFKIINLFINQEKTEFFIKAIDDKLQFQANSLETEYKYEMDVETHKDNIYNITYIKPSVLSRFRNIKNLTSSFDMCIYTYNDVDYELILRSHESKPDMTFFISIPLKSKY